MADSLCVDSKLGDPLPTKVIAGQIRERQEAEVDMPSNPVFHSYFIDEKKSLAVTEQNDSGVFRVWKARSWCWRQRCGKKD